MDEILKRLESLHPKIIDLKLDRVKKLLRKLGNPERSLPPIIHVAGTNGKGSTIAMIKAGLEKSGLKAHVYTSPHLVNFNERIEIGGKRISENALKKIPVPIDITSVGIGTSHRFSSTNQNARCLLALDNLIQSPIVSTSQTTGLSTNVSTVDNIISLSGIQSYFGSDLIKMGNEIMKITAVGVGSTNAVTVRRGQLGTKIGIGSTGDAITKVVGNYNITDSTLHFAEAPFGGQPIGSTTNRPDERDWEGITQSSSFQGRTFMRSGIEYDTDDTYSTNYIFDSYHLHNIQM